MFEDLILAFYLLISPFDISVRVRKLNESDL